ncbi:ribosome biogenesis GTP-binding protein YihA/YsxC [uncultured Fretibacterium sp.]|uniref:ribosome biogenesis GTP-binding protein YihA/YsxC n=1 Tax=uncultured Fretibacterium sp. TaxID=1678694 RepID=UPI002626E02B|nr:ribosome biogenesis GTP-binding protein YihA/YsxC [uncultured Fretibacterium sp.]
MLWKASLEATCFSIPQLPPEGMPEVAVAGRSNVGKSTLINALLGTRLAHVGATPGKTRSINFYSVQASAPFRLVDLPGYGYASRSKTERNEWSRLVAAYVERRRTLRLVCHLVDFRHGLLGNDRALQEWLNECGRTMLVVFTKADKISRGRHRALLQEYVRGGLISVDVPVITSGENRSGIEDLRNFIGRFLGGAGTEGDGLR